MASPRRADWALGPGPSFSWEAAHAAILMDIRDDLTALRGIFECGATRDIPRQLRAINRNTRRPKKKHGH